MFALLLLYMAKRRTRSEKEEAKHHFLYTWEKEAKKASVVPSVNSQIQTAPDGEFQPLTSVKKARIMAQVYDLASIKRSILRSLIMSSLVLCLELMIYLAWNK